MLLFCAKFRSSRLVFGKAQQRWTLCDAWLWWTWSERDKCISEKWIQVQSVCVRPFYNIYRQQFVCYPWHDTCTGRLPFLFACIILCWQTVYPLISNRKWATESIINEMSCWLVWSRCCCCCCWPVSTWKDALHVTDTLYSVYVDLRNPFSIVWPQTGKSITLNAKIVLGFLLHILLNPNPRIYTNVNICVQYASEMMGYLRRNHFPISRNVVKEIK